MRNEIIGRSQMIGLSRDQEIALGVQAQPQMVQEMGGKVPDVALQQYVTEVGRTLAALTEGDNPSLPWEFTFLDSKEINAFALPGGKVFITRGLASQMTNEAQLASVLGHEVGHVTARHTAERIGQANMTQTGMQLGSVVLGGASAEVQQLGGIALQLGGTLVPLKFSRDQELEADALGMRYMTKAGYNPVGALQVMQILARASGGGGGGLSSLLATHPDPEARAARIQSQLNGPYAAMTRDPKYQTHEQRFADRMKRRLGMLPPPAHGSGETGLALADPMTWCGHCRALAAHGAAEAFAGY